MKHYIAFLIRLLITLVLLLVTQVIFYVYNNTIFSVDGIKDFFSITLGATRFGVSSLIIFLMPYIVLSILPIPLRQNKYYHKVSIFFYFLGTILMIAVNCVDMGYYKFTFKRLTFDIFNYLGVGGDFKELIPQFLRDFWSIVLVFIGLVIALCFINKLIEKKFNPEYINADPKWYVKNIIAAILVFGFSIIGIRGGTQVKPINLINAHSYTSSLNAALVLNTPFTLYRTYGKECVTRVQYFKEEKNLNSYFNPISIPSHNTEIDSIFSSPLEVGKTNVVVIILESFSAEYMACYNKTSPSYTPFLDSISKQSIIFDGYANGKRSIDGIPAIISALPQLMDESFITSAYCNDKVSSFASLLKPFGYNTSFFHGGYNGSMGFDGFSGNVGYDKYYGRREYNNDKDYDGNWGIFDEPFLQYMVKKLNNTPQPFTSAVFTLSSHHPYTVPTQHIGRFPKGSMIVHETVGYADYALKRFFEEASKQPWFKNTLFVITADHSAQTSQPEFKTFLGQYRIPILFYHPSIKKGVHINQYMQQTDILPTTMALIGYKKPVFAFGQNALNKEEKFYILHNNGEYILRIGDYLSKYRDGFETDLFYMPNDKRFKLNIAQKDKKLTLKHKLKTQAIIQQFNNRLMDNKLLP